MRLRMKYYFTLCLTLPFYARAVLVNATVDDSSSDPFTGRTILYSPVGGWGTENQCPGCTAHPDPGQFYEGTWHDSTFNPQTGSNDVPNQPFQARFTFTGTAVYVICVLARTTTGPTGDSDMSFFINGTLMNTFSKPAPGTNGYDYNVTVYSAPSLPPGLHDLTIQNGHINGPKSLMLLDAIVYTFDDSPRNSKASPPIPVNAIVGGVIGGLAFLIATILGFLWWRKRKSRHDAQQDEFQPLVFGSTPAAHSPSRYAQISPFTPPMTSNVSGSGYVDEPPAYELDGFLSSSRSGSRNNDPAPPRQGVKRR